MAEKKREAISHTRICKRICDALNIESRKITKKVKFDCLAEGDKGNIILEAEGLSKSAAISNLHAEGHLSRILGMLV